MHSFSFDHRDKTAIVHGVTGYGEVAERSIAAVLKTARPDRAALPFRPVSTYETTAYRPRRSRKARMAERFAMAHNQAQPERVFFTVEEYAEWIGVSRHLLMKAIRAGRIRYLSLGRLVRVNPNDVPDDIVEDLVDQHRRIMELREAQQLYFIQAGDGPIKIGIAADVGARLLGLQTAHYEPLRLLASVPGGRALELGLHRKFAHLHLRGEWFSSSPDIMVEIERLNL